MFARENPIIASPAFKLAAQWLSQSLVMTQTSSRGSPESRTACGTIGKIPQVFEDFNGDFRNRFYIHKAYVSGQNFRPETYRPYQFQGISSQNMPKHMVLTYLHFGFLERWGLRHQLMWFPGAVDLRWENTGEMGIFSNGNGDFPWKTPLKFSQPPYFPWGLEDDFPILH